MSKDLLKEAIADAKAVRQTAIANAKLALEEAFTPKLQSMLAAKINEQEDLSDLEDEEESTDDLNVSSDVEGAIDDAESLASDDEVDLGGEEEEGEEDLELESIIRELESGDEEEDEEELEEG